MKRHLNQFIGGEKVELVELSCQNIKNEILATHSKEVSFSSSRYYRGGYFIIPHFFNIYFSTINNSFLDGLDNSFNSGERFYPTIWRVDELDFFSFHDSILWLLLSKLLIKRKNLRRAKPLEIKSYLEEECSLFFESETIGSLELLTLSYNADSHYKNNNSDFDGSSKSYEREIYNIVLKLTDDKLLVNFINKLLSNLLEYRKCNFATLNTNDFSKKDKNKIKNNIKTLFCLLRDNREILLPFISESGLDKYFPNHCEFSKKEILRCVKDNISEIIRDDEDVAMIRNFCKEHLFKGREIEIYAKRNNVFYKVIGFGDDCFASKKEDVIFPNASHDFLSKKCEDVLNPIFRNLTILNHNTNSEEIIIEPTTFWLDIESLTESIVKFIYINDADSNIVAESQIIKSTIINSEIKNNQTILEPDLAKTKATIAGTALGALIEEHIKQLMKEGFDPKPREVFASIFNNKPWTQPIHQMEKGEIWWHVPTTGELKKMTSKTFANAVKTYKNQLLGKAKK